MCKRFHCYVTAFPMRLVHCRTRYGHQVSDNVFTYEMSTYGYDLDIVFECSIEYLSNNYTENQNKKKVLNGLILFY